VYTKLSYSDKLSSKRKIAEGNISFDDEVQKLTMTMIQSSLLKNVRIGLFFLLLFLFSSSLLSSSSDEDLFKQKDNKKWMSERKKSISKINKHRKK